MRRWGDRDWSEVSVSQGTPRTASSQPEEGLGTDSPLEPPEGTHPADFLDFRLVVSRTGRG